MANEYWVMTVNIDYKETELNPQKGKDGFSAIELNGWELKSQDF